MANTVQIPVYKINQRPPIPLADAQAIAFPVTQCVLRDCSRDLPTRSLSTGVNVYGVVQFGNTLYYTSQTLAQLVTSFG